MAKQPRSRKFVAGLRIRREVVGKEHVDKSMSKATEFTLPLQEYVTEYCWGSIWARPGLSRKTRSLINLGMLTALNRPHELRFHVSGALRNGCTKQEIMEALLQATFYCGGPAGLDAFRVAEEAIAEAKC